MISRRSPTGAVNPVEAIGRSSPLGATILPGGVNFSLFSRSALHVELLLFDREDDARPARAIRIDPVANRTYHYWHVFVPDVQLVDEFRDMVKALHRTNIDVILDVVFNHTAEGDQWGPTLCFRGLENDAYYILEQDRSRYANYSVARETYRSPSFNCGTTRIMCAREH